LSAVRWIGDRQTPIIGVKFGEVGFLAETTEDHLCEAAEAILNDQFTTRPQMRLQIQAVCAMVSRSPGSRPSTMW
jgi:NAD+ kinase